MKLQPKHTATVLGVVLILLLGYEGASIVWGEQATISEVVWTLTEKMPLVPFLAGMLAGHFWFVKGKCVHCGLKPWAK